MIVVARRSDPSDAGTVGPDSAFEGTLDGQSSRTNASRPSVTSRLRRSGSKALSYLGLAPKTGESCQVFGLHH